MQPTLCNMIENATFLNFGEVDIKKYEECEAVPLPLGQKIPSTSNLGKAILRLECAHQKMHEHELH